MLLFPLPTKKFLHSLPQNYLMTLGVTSVSTIETNVHLKIILNALSLSIICLSFTEKQYDFYSICMSSHFELISCVAPPPPIPLINKVIFQSPSTQKSFP